jgi:hypothetical protein
MRAPRPFLSALFLAFFAPYLVFGPLPAYALRDLSAVESPPKQAGLEESLLTAGQLPASAAHQAGGLEEKEPKPYKVFPEPSQAGHIFGIESIGFDPEGYLLLSASLDKSVRSWELSSGHTDWVTSLAFSPDTEMLISGGMDGAIRLWDIQQGRSLQDLPARAGRVWSLALSPDGKTLAVGGDDHAIHLFGMTGDLVPRLLDGPVLKSALDPARHLVFSPDGKRLATSGSQDDAAVEVWDAVSGRSLKQVPTGKWTRSIASHPNGEILAAAVNQESAKTIQLWKLGDLPDLPAPEAGAAPARPLYTPKSLVGNLHVQKFKISLSLKEAEVVLASIKRQQLAANPVTAVVA